MKILKRVLLFIAALIVIILITALFVGKEMKASRDIVINKPNAEVFNYIKYVKNQDNFSIWNKLEPGIKKTYSGTDGTVGFNYAWDSNNGDVGKGEQTITAIKEGERLNCDLHFIKPFDSRAKTFLATAAVNDSTTKVTWGFEGKMMYPLNIMRLFMDMDKAIADDFSIGLANLKTVLEK